MQGSKGTGVDGGPRPAQPSPRMRGRRGGFSTFHSMYARAPAHLLDRLTQETQKAGHEVATALTPDITGNVSALHLSVCRDEGEITHLLGRKSKSAKSNRLSGGAHADESLSPIFGRKSVRGSRRDTATTTVLEPSLPNDDTGLKGFAKNWWQLLHLTCQKSPFQSEFFTVRHIPAGVFLFRQGSDCYCMYILLTGDAVAVQMAATGVSQSVRLSPGQVRSTLLTSPDCRPLFDSPYSRLCGFIRHRRRSASLRLLDKDFTSRP